MLGSITGDMAGSIYEGNNIKTKDFELLSEKCFFRVKYSPRAPACLGSVAEHNRVLKISQLLRRYKKFKLAPV